MPRKIIITKRQSCRAYRRYRRRGFGARRATTANGFGSLGAFLLIGVVLTGVLYLFSMNEAAIQGDALYTMERDIAALARENERLIVQEAQLKSLENVEKIVRERGMREIADATYIEKDSRIALTQQ